MSMIPASELTALKSWINPYSRQITALLKSSQKVMVAMVGPSGCGKSVASKVLIDSVHAQSQLDCIEYSHSYLNLDMYRCEVNHGKYPSTDREHRSVNAIAIPKYLKDLEKVEARFVVVDNTNLSYKNGLEAVFLKCARSKYHLLTITPPWRDAMFVRNASEHGVPTNVFLDMMARWPGHSFSPFLYKIVHPDLLLGSNFKPLKKERFNKISFIKPWPQSKVNNDKSHEKPGFLYVMNNYLGYMDPSMFDVLAPAYERLKEMKEEELFLKKDGNLHITIVPPRINHDKKDLVALAERLIASGDPPALEYSGVHRIYDKGDDNLLYFITLTKESQSAWKTRYDSLFDDEKPPAKSASKKTTNGYSLRDSYNPDGLHITLGYTHSDKFNIKKDVEPQFKFKTPFVATKNPLPKSLSSSLQSLLRSSPAHHNNNAEQDSNVSSQHPIFYPPLKGLNIKVSEHSKSNAVSEFLASKLKVKPEDIRLQISSDHVDNITTFLSHTNVKSKYRKTPDKFDGDYILLGFQVVLKKFVTIDEEIYKRDPFLQQRLPRGLTYVFKIDKDTSTNNYRVSLPGIIYPTSKFFGDNDLDNDVAIETDEAIQEAAEKASQFVITDKANGEMFTFSVVDKLNDDATFICALGSKNNKFLFEFKPGKTTMQDIKNTLKLWNGGSYTEDFESNLGWTMQNVWIEMCEYFFAKLLAIESSQATTFLQTIYSEKQTACGEFESYLHGHLELFPQGYKAIKFFAITTYNDDGSFKTSKISDRLAQLEWLRSLGFDTIKTKEVDVSTSILDLRHEVWDVPNREGIVLLVIQNGELSKMVKMKTIWYVVFRGLRERLRRHLFPNKKQKQQLTGQISSEKFWEETVKKELRQVLINKLRIFKKDQDESVRQAWFNTIDLFVEKLRQFDEINGRAALETEFEFFYPRLINSLKTQDDDQISRSFTRSIVDSGNTNSKNARMRRTKKVGCGHLEISS